MCSGTLFIPVSSCVGRSSSDKKQSERSSCSLIAKGLLVLQSPAPHEARLMLCNQAERQNALASGPSGVHTCNTHTGLKDVDRFSRLTYLEELD